MGGKAWDYFVDFEPDIESALEKLRRREFEAGRFAGSELEPADEILAFANSAPDGTASILDMLSVSEEREFCAVAPLTSEELLTYFETEQPTREMVENNQAFFEDIERGQGIYIICYADGKPTEIYFAGYSFD